MPISSTHLSTSQVAETLGVSQSTLANMLRDPDSTFPPPDVVIGDRFQGWAPETIDEWRDGERDVNKIFIDFEKVREYSNAIEQAAEWVRISIPRLTESRRDGTALARTLADDIGRVAFDLLGEGRAYTSVSHCSSMTFASESGVQQHLFSALPVYVLAQDINSADVATCIDQVHSAARSIDMVASQLHLALSTSRTRTYELRLRTVTRRLYKEAADAEQRRAATQASPAASTHPEQEHPAMPSYTYELEVGSKRHPGGTFTSALDLANHALALGNRLSPTVSQNPEGVALDIERGHSQLDLRLAAPSRVTIHIIK